MGSVKISLADGRELTCPHRLSGSDLLSRLESWAAITLESVTPLRGGDSLRSCLNIDARVESIDLSGYANIFCSATKR